MKSGNVILQKETGQLLLIHAIGRYKESEEIIAFMLDDGSDSPIFYDRDELYKDFIILGKL